MDWREKLPFLRWNAAGDAVVLDFDDAGEVGWGCADGSVISMGTDPRLAEYEAECQTASSISIKQFKQGMEQMHDAIIDLRNPEPFPRAWVREHPGFAAWIAGECPDYKPTWMELRLYYPAYMERLRLLKERRIGDPDADEEGYITTTHTSEFTIRKRPDGTWPFQATHREGEEYAVGTKKELAKMLGTTPKTLNIWAKKGTIAVEKLTGGRFRIRKADVDRLSLKRT